MNEALQRDVAQALSLNPSRLRDVQSVSGGCINDAWRIQTDDGETYFVKSNHRLPEMFRAEAQGLAAIAATETVRVPNVVACNDNPMQPFLIIEWIEAGPKSSLSQQALGTSLALLHKCSSSQQYGFGDDNFVGETPQPNPVSSNWVEFWATQRLEHQLKLASDNGVGSPELQTLGRGLIERLNQLLPDSNEAPSLIHGDLWSGNWMADDTGKPILIDPAAYWADRESEFGMMTLFGDFSPEFYDAYQEVYPLRDGWQDRVTIYRLYHVLNHLNLFGQSYLGGCLEILRQFK